MGFDVRAAPRRCVTPAIKDPNAARRILGCLKRSARAPPLAEASLHPNEPSELEGGRFFDQPAACDSP
jgi:hypothetical protein